MTPHLRSRKHLPHPNLASGAVSVTWCLHRSHRDLSPVERDIVLDVIARTPREWCSVLALVVMDDHVHVLAELTPTKPPWQLAQAWKSISAREIVRLGSKRSPIWQAEYFDRPIRSAAQLDACARYILANPIRRWAHATGYRWVRDLR